MPVQSVGTRRAWLTSAEVIWMIACQDRQLSLERAKCQIWFGDGKFLDS
jgi:hypothetical protein